MSNPITARCHCGALQVRLARVADERHMCCCSDCQRRTGAPGSVSWYYDAEDLLGVSGAYGTFERVGTRGTRYAFHFCLGCGSNVLWRVAGSGAVGVAAACVPAEHHAAPMDVVWAPSRPAWFEPPRDIAWYEKGTSSPVIHDPQTS